MSLKYFPENIIINGKSKVYFSCTAGDFERLFSHNADMILECCPDTVIFYDNQHGQEYKCEANQQNTETADLMYEEHSYEYLEEMQLVVFMITVSAFSDKNLLGEMQYAISNHIPILPLLQDGIMPDDFEKIAKGVHCLSESEPDMTAVPFKEKLKAFLNSVLINDELAEQIRAAFDAYIFVSYRKKDRAYAKKVMSLIHKNDFCRDIAAWYDEFLVPGEDYNDAIIAAMKKSKIFTLVITPNLLEEGNYVLCHEYPDASKLPVEKLPIEAVATDREALLQSYEGLSGIVSAEDENALRETLISVVNKIAIKEKTKDERHLFFIGLAYLMGIDMEKDVDKGISLISEAADLGLHEAHEKLVDIYRNGIGTEKRMNQAYNRQFEYFRLLDQSVNKDSDIHQITHFFDQCIKGAEICMEVFEYERNNPYLEVGQKNEEESKANHEKYTAFLDQFLENADYYTSYVINRLNWIKEKDLTLFLIYLCAIQERFGLIYEKQHRGQEAIKVYEAAIHNYKYLIERCNEDKYKTRLAYCYYQAGEIRWNGYVTSNTEERERQVESIYEAEERFEKAFEIYKSLFKLYDTPEIRRVYIKLVDALIHVKTVINSETNENYADILLETEYIALKLYERTKSGEDAYSLGSIYELETRLVPMPKAMKINKYEQYTKLAEVAYRKTGRFFYQLLWKGAEGKLKQLKEEA